MFLPDGHERDPRRDGPLARRTGSATAAQAFARSGGGAALTDDWRAGGFGVYVHWPFCAAKCPYCDFNSHVRAAVDTRPLAAGAGRPRSPRAAREVPGSGRRHRVLRRRHPEPDAAGDGRRGARRDRRRLDAGARRRGHAGGQSRPRSRPAGSAAIATPGSTGCRWACRRWTTPTCARSGGCTTSPRRSGRSRSRGRRFRRVSFDLIYARQGQTLDGLARGAASGRWRMAVDHLSLYQLTIEAGHAVRRSRRARPAARPARDRGGGRHVSARPRTSARSAGLAGYEISNHARPGAESRHNLVYWRYGDYVGVGPGAHGRLTLGGQRLGDRLRPRRPRPGWPPSRPAIRRDGPRGDRRAGPGGRDD